MYYFLVGAACFLFGLLTTRWAMAPSFCPRCMLHNKWLEEKRKENNGGKKS